MVRRYQKLTLYLPQSLVERIEELFSLNFSSAIRDIIDNELDNIRNLLNDSNFVKSTVNITIDQYNKLSKIKYTGKSELVRIMILIYLTRLREIGGIK